MLAARDAWHYERVVVLCDPATVEAHFRYYCDYVRLKTLDDFRREEPDLDDDTLAKALARWNETVGDREAWIEKAVPGVRSHAELIRLRPAEYMWRRLASDDPHAAAAAQYRQAGQPVPAALSEAPTHIRYVALGAVPEPPDLAHVLYRGLLGGPSDAPVAGRVELESLRRQEDGRRAVLLSSRPL